MNTKIKEMLQAMRNEDFVIVYDMETTGLNAKTNHPIQIAAKMCAVCENNGAVSLDEVGNVCWYINPGYVLPETIVKLTGITDEFLADKPKEGKIFDEIYDFFKNRLVIGYNSQKFDDEFMRNLYLRHGKTFEPVASADVYPMSKDLLSPVDVENFKLATVTEYLGYASLIERFHNAEGDVLSTYLCLNHYLEEYAKPVEAPTVDYNAIKAKVQRVSKVWMPKRQDGYKYSRIYVTTDKAELYYMFATKEWKAKTGDVAKFDTVDVAKQVVLLGQVEDISDLEKLNHDLTA